MANLARPRGLVPVRYFNGSPWTGQARPYYAPSTYAVNLFIGDPVVITGDANATELMGKMPGTLSEVNLGAAGDGVAITGVLVGVDPLTRESTIYRSASVATKLFVCDDPNVVFQLTGDGTGTPIADWVGLNANLVSGSGSTYTGRSGWGLDENSDPPAADASNQLIILGLSDIPGNEIGAYATWDVLINQHTYKPASGLGIS